MLIYLLISMRFVYLTTRDLGCIYKQNFISSHKKIIVKLIDIYFHWAHTIIM
ncbi:hypothetical protein AAHE18_19G030200 [Arachis hypogaea]